MRRGGRRDDGGYGGGGEYIQELGDNHKDLLDLNQFKRFFNSYCYTGYDRRDGPYSRGGGGGYGNHARDNYGQFSC